MNKWFDRARNRKERMKFVELWAEYVRTHSDREWSKQQKIVVDSQLKSLITPNKNDTIITNIPKGTVENAIKKAKTAFIPCLNILILSKKPNIIIHIPMIGMKQYHMKVSYLSQPSGKPMAAPKVHTKGCKSHF